MRGRVLTSRFILRIIWISYSYMIKKIAKCSLAKVLTCRMLVGGGERIPAPCEPGTPYRVCVCRAPTLPYHLISSKLIKRSFIYFWCVPEVNVMQGDPNFVAILAVLAADLLVTFAIVEDDVIACTVAPLLEAFPDDRRPY